MNILEIAVYVGALTGAAGGYDCSLSADEKRAACTNGLSAAEASAKEVRFSNDTVLTRGDRGELWFSNGLAPHIDAAHWLHFGNGIAVYRERPTRFRFNTGVVCERTEPTKAVCAPRK